MKKLLFQKFIQDNFKIFSAVILSIGSIVWIIQSVNFLDFVTNDGHSFKIYFYYSILNFPKIIHRILPFIFFISLFYQIIHYEENNQLLIFWMHGVKKIQLINIILTYSILLAIIQIFLGGFISPKGQDTARSFIRSSNLDFFSSLVSPGKFVDTVENLTIFIEKENKMGFYENIFLKDDFEGNTEKIKSQIIFAKTAKLINSKNERYFRLFDGKLIKIQNKKIDSFEFKSIDFDLSKFATKTTTFPKIGELTTKLLIKCAIYEYKNELKNFSNRNLMCNESSVLEVKEELFKRFYKPIYIPLIALIACLLILKSKESEKYKFSKFLLFVIIFFTIIISEISLRYSTYNLMGMLFFILFPILSFFLIYFTLIRKFKY
ncbi:LptF/LptG family permease, partial [Pelagibacteraceae bacterium]|nr:LptF/LptG family permease [Pelagibacteraceae bacterium]